MLSRCQLWYFPRHTPLGSSTMPGLADATDSARATVGVRQEIRVTRLYRARMPSGWIGLDWTGFDWTALVPSAHETFPRRIPFIYFFFSSVPWYDFTCISGERESGSLHFCTFFSLSLSHLTYSLLTVFQALAWVGAWVIGVLCAMETIGRSSADRYTFSSCRQLVQFFFWSDEKALFSASHAYHYTICIVSHS